MSFLDLCPFCKCPPFHAVQEIAEDEHFVWCDTCEARGPVKTTPDAAISAYNTRMS